MDYVIVNGELYHHGVKGMKWGVRKKRVYDEKKAAYKTAKKEYNQAFRKADNRALAAYSPSKKHRQANDARWENAVNKAEALNKAKKEYKSAKKDYKREVRAEKKQFKADVKNMKSTINNRYSNIVDEKTGVHLGVRDNVVGLHNDIRTKKGQAYADKVAKTASNQIKAEAITSMAVFTAGMSYVALRYSL